MAGRTHAEPTASATVHTAAVQQMIDYSSDMSASRDSEAIKLANNKVLAENGPLPVPAASGTSAEDAALNRALRKVSWIVLPQLFLAVSTNYLDRTALSFASLQMNADLQLSTQQYGLAAATFALGYGIGHIPSAYMGMKVGIRVWYAIITISWGVVAMFAALVRDAQGLYWQRAVLGLAEAGAMPCAMHLLAQFYPRSRLTQPMTTVSLGLTLSTIVAPPLAAGLMSIDAGGLKGWQWLFILEGFPPVLLGLIMLWALPSRPLNGNAWMLTPQEQQMLETEVHGALAVSAGRPRSAPSVRELMRLMLEAAKKPIMWYLTAAGFLWVLCVHSLNAFLPIIIKNMLAGTAATGSTSTGGDSATNTRNAMLLSAIPYATAAVFMSLTAWHSDRVKERSLHIGCTAIAGAVLWLCFGPMYHLSFAAGFVSLVLAMALAYAQVGVMYARVSEPLDARHVAIGVALFNAVGAAVGGFLGPYVTGAVVQRMGSFVKATLIQGSFLLASGVMTVSLGIWEQVHKRNTARLLGAGSNNTGSNNKQN